MMKGVTNEYWENEQKYEEHDARYTYTNIIWLDNFLGVLYMMHLYPSVG